jgi:hypothetical protein
LPREQRVEVIDMSLRALISMRRENDERSAFLAGYFASLLAPGTLDHADILAPVASLLPTAYLWYGLFAGMNVRGECLPIGNLLARRIVRDLTLPDRLVDRPRCDVALEEMAMVGPGENVLRLTGKSGRLEIDILPGVTTAVRWPLHTEPGEEDLRRARDRELQHVLMEIDQVGSRWRYLSERLREMLHMTEGNRQASPRRKRGGKP